MDVIIIDNALVTSSDGLQPTSDGLQPTSFLLLVAFVIIHDNSGIRLDWHL